MFSISACSKKSEDNFFDEQLENRSKKASVLLHDFDARMFNCGLQNIFSTPVVMDTVIYGIKKKDDEYFLHARINTDCDKKYFTELKCTYQIVEQFNQSKSNYALIAARITDVFNYNLTAEADSLEGEISQLNLGNTVLLSGECLAFAEVPPIVSSN